MLSTLDQAPPTPASAAMTTSTTNQLSPYIQDGSSLPTYMRRRLGTKGPKDSDSILLSVPEVMQRRLTACTFDSGLCAV
jgi:hypothetical protein